LPPRERRRLLFPDEWDACSAFDMLSVVVFGRSGARRIRVDPLVL